MVVVFLVVLTTGIQSDGSWSDEILSTGMVVAAPLLHPRDDDRFVGQNVRTLGLLLCTNLTHDNLT